MTHELKESLSHVLWIGGATDSGKTTVSRIIAARYGLQLYNYDQHDLAQVKQLAQTQALYQAFFSDSLEELWIHPEPEQLMQRTLRAFRDRFPLVVADLRRLPREPMIVAEGFGLTPEFLSPLISRKQQAIWLVPTEEFKLASMKRRNKPSFRQNTSDPERATRNLLARDMLLAEHIRAQTLSYGLKLYEVNGSRSAEEVAAWIEGHFAPFLQSF